MQVIRVLNILFLSPPETVKIALIILIINVDVNAAWKII